MVEVKEILEVPIKSISIEGKGIGEYFDKEDNQTYKVFVPFTSPGDLVRAKVTEIKKHINAELYEILEESQIRQKAPCPYFEKCGGCNIMHIKYEEQINEKQNLVEHLLSKAKIRKKQILPIIKSEEFDFRTRARFHGKFLKKKYELGYYKPKTHEIVDLDFCMVCNPTINETLEKFRKHLDSLSKEAKNQKESFEEFKFELQIAGDDKNSHIDFLCPKKHSEFAEHLMNTFKKKNNKLVTGYSIKNLLEKKQNEKTNKKNVTSFYYNFTDLDFQNIKFLYDPDNFTQVNLEQNEILVSLVKKWVQDFDKQYSKDYQNSNREKERKILDLYCGIGNFTLPLSKLTTKILGIEYSKSAVENAKLNAQANGIINAEFVAGDVETELKNMNSVKFDKIILDPPRTGCNEILKHILKLKARQIIYVSCNPRSLVKDLLVLQEKGYQINRVQPLDMFPQTSHIETVVELIANV